MSRIRSRDTKPERFVRSVIHGMGYRFTVRAPGNQRLPGKPDLVLTRHRLVIFVHGCFWHQCPHCREGRVPASRHDYWEPKLRRNVERDRASLEALHAAGWRTLVIWECQAKEAAAIAELVRGLLGDSRMSPQIR